MFLHNCGNDLGCTLQYIKIYIIVFITYLGSTLQYITVFITYLGSTLQYIKIYIIVFITYLGSTLQYIKIYFIVLITYGLRKVCFFKVSQKKAYKKID